MKKLLALYAILFSTNNIDAQLIRGYNVDEYRECVCMASHFSKQILDSIYMSPEPTHSQRIYASPEVGFDNMWELWQMDNTYVISLRSSLPTMLSWMANFHAAMLPAQGSVTLGKKFNYDFSADTLAHVHAGWTVSTCVLMDDILPKIDSLYKCGARDFIVTGHSQGGGLAYLVTAALIRMQQKGTFPTDVRIKTYCSASPKPGDYAFAMWYEHYTYGWSINVVNADDWVPEVPLSEQLTNDFRPTNPFAHMDELSQYVSAKDRLKVKFLLSRLNKPTRRSERALRRYLGSVVGSMLRDSVPSYVVPEFSVCANYARCGNSYILMTNDDYHKRHPQNAKDPFEHHMFKSYYELTFEEQNLPK